MSTVDVEGVDQLIPALIAAKAAFKPAIKNATNPHRGNRYADLSSVQDAYAEALAANGLALIHETVARDGTMTLVTWLYHASGQSISSTYPIAVDLANAQAIGSALTYGRRYAACALLDIVAEEDDDGEAASGARDRPRTRQEPRRPKPVPNGHDGASTRQGVNDDFPQRRPEVVAEPFVSYLARTLAEEKRAWTHAMIEAQVPEAERHHPNNQLPGREQIINHLCKLGIASTLIKVEDVSDDAGKRDLRKAARVVGALFERMPGRVKGRVAEYFREHEATLRKQLGMDVEGDDLPKATATREPGEEG